jgi:cell division protein FtsW
MGLAGTLTLVGLFMGFLVMAMYISGRAPDLLGFLLSAGSATLLTVQAGTNMAVTTGLLPTKGLALPFISAGGSSLIVSLTLVGVILNVGLQTVEEDRTRPRVPSGAHPAWSR